MIITNTRAFIFSNEWRLTAIKDLFLFVVAMPTPDCLYNCILCTLYTIQYCRVCQAILTVFFNGRYGLFSFFVCTLMLFIVSFWSVCMYVYSTVRAWISVAFSPILPLPRIALRPLSPYPHTVQSFTCRVFEQKFKVFGLFRC